MLATKAALASGGITHCCLRCGLRMFFLRPPDRVVAGALDNVQFDDLLRKARHDYEYERNGVANLFMVFAPLEGWRHVKVTDHHTAIDYAQDRKSVV